MNILGLISQLIGIKTLRLTSFTQSVYKLALCTAMGNQRFAQISTSDEEEEAPRKPSDEIHPRRKRLKHMKLLEEEDEEQQQQQKQ